MFTYCARCCADHPLPVARAQLLCRLLCRLPSSGGLCTTIVQAFVQISLFRRLVHNYCARCCADHPLPVARAQLLCTLLCRDRYFTSICTTATHYLYSLSHGHGHGHGHSHSLSHGHGLSLHLSPDLSSRLDPTHTLTAALRLRR